ncbi:MAG: DedA family protein [Magnetococcales bacterium]|nr:DedA family protein [Magnetococcales bacterium]MBF0260522.1 DedA family protein [Magnetococcales bacterium]
MDAGLLSLFLAALLAATILPFSSEALLAGMLLQGSFAPWHLWVAATLGNVLGALINWYLARFCLAFQDRSWFPVDADTLRKGGERFRGWGEWSLLFSWVPVIGDPLTFAAGVLQVPIWRFLFWVALGKGGRYYLVLMML